MQDHASRLCTSEDWVSERFFDSSRTSHHAVSLAATSNVICGWFSMKASGASGTVQHIRRHDSSSPSSFFTFSSSACDVRGGFCPRKRGALFDMFNGGGRFIMGEYSGIGTIPELGRTGVISV